MKIQAGGDMTGMGTAWMYGNLLLGLAKVLTVGSASMAEHIRHSLAQARTERDLLGDLRTVLVRHGYASSSARKYAACVTVFLEHTGCRSLHSLRDDDVVDWLNGLRDGGLSNASLRLHLCALRAVFDRLLGMNITAGLVHVPRPAPRKRAAAADVARLKSTCRLPEEHLLVELLYDRGLRPGRIRLCRPGQESEEASPGREVSTRTLLRMVKRLGEACGLSLTCEDVRLAWHEEDQLTAA